MVWARAVDLSEFDTGEIVTQDHAQPSPDGEYWVFRWGDPVRTQCFFAPLQGT